jgi:predicted SAM-dependent methyltransferase
MSGQSLMAVRRAFTSAFHTRYFVGKGIDIGSGWDSLKHNINEFRGIVDIDDFDMPQGDAQYVKGIANNSYDFVHSAHCLEHLIDPVVALSNWLRIVKIGGYLIIVVPDEDLYEHGFWPSKFNSDHKHTFTIYKEKSWSPVSINVIDLLLNFKNIEIEKIEVIKNFFRESYSKEIDQTMTPNTECVIEFIVKKLPKKIKLLSVPLLRKKRHG